MSESGGVFTRWSKQYFFEYLIVLVFCVVAAWFCIPLARASVMPLSKLIWMLPLLIAILWMAFVVYRHFQRVDEFLRRTMLQSFAAIGALVFIGSLSYALLELAGFPRISMWWVWGCAVVIWNIRILLHWTIRG